MTCEDCQLACYDLLDRRLGAKDERDVLEHVESCPRCWAFLEAEGERMRSWPRLLSVATRKVSFPQDAAERVAHALDVSRGSDPGGRLAAWPPTQFSRWASRRLAFAASALVLASLGGAVCLVRDQLQREGMEIRIGDAAEAAVPPIRLVDQKQVTGLEVPETLPGMLKLESGEIVVRLQTGVDLALLGPASVEVQTGMRVCMERGRLLAKVPNWATGFTVRTRALEVYDLGTVFSVSAEESVSEVFVFKGRVQVNEAGGAAIAGDGVGIFEAGEGVRTERGEPLVQFGAEGEEALKLFGPVKGCAALKNPLGAFQAASEIAKLCATRHLPESKRVAQGKAKGKGRPQLNKSRGRPSVPVAADADVAVARVTATGVQAAAAAQAEELFYSASGPGCNAWDVVPSWVIHNSGGTLSGRLPSASDNVRISAATLAAEDGKALTVTNGVFAECAMFASGDQNYLGTTQFRLDGGSLTCATHFITGRYYPGLTTLESGSLYGGGDFYIGSQAGGYGTVTNNGAMVNLNSVILANYTADAPSVLVQNGGSLAGRTDVTIGNRGEAVAIVNGGTLSVARTCYVGRVTGSVGALVLNGGSVTGRSDVLVGDMGRGVATLNGGTLSAAGNLTIGFAAGGSGTLTNNGASLSAANIQAGYVAGASGRLVHNAGSLNAGTYLQIGRSGGVGSFEANAAFSAKIMIVGAGLAPAAAGTGTVTVAEGVAGTIDESLRIYNGDLFMRGGVIHLQNVNNPLRTNLMVRVGQDRRGQLRGWGVFTNVNENITLRMLNNGQVVADGEGAERDLNMNMIAVVLNDVTNGPSGSTGWYAVNKGRLFYPRSMSVTFPANTPATTSCGDHYSKAVPELVNSFSATLTYSTAATRAIRGGLCAFDRSDIPAELPARLRPVGLWFIGSFDTNKLTPSKASFISAALTFRYDQGKLRATDSSLRLYRHTGSAWVKVGECTPDGSSLISTAGVLAPLASGNYNVGWFAAMAVEPIGTLISVR